MAPGERLYVIGANDAEATPVQGSNVDRAEPLRYRRTYLFSDLPRRCGKAFRPGAAVLQVPNVTGRIGIDGSAHSELALE
jgi:hypothetical protein